MKSDYSRQYDAFERNHWWFRVRRIVLKGLLDRHVGWKPGLRVVEVGTGPGENLQALYPADVALAGVEPDPANAELAALYEADQAPRQTSAPLGLVVSEQDRARRARVRELMAQGALTSGMPQASASNTRMVGMPGSSRT